MRKATIPILILGLALAAAAPALPAEGPGEVGDAAGLVEQVAQLNRSMQRLVHLLERQQEHRELDLVLKRIELHERRLAPLEAELLRAQGLLQSTRTEGVRVQGMIEESEEQLRAEIRDGTDVPGSGTRRMIDEIERAVGSLGLRTDQYERTVRRLEDDLADGRRQVEILDEVMEQLLAEPGL